MCRPVNNVCLREGRGRASSHDRASVDTLAVDECWLVCCSAGRHAAFVAYAVLMYQTDSDADDAAEAAASDDDESVTPTLPGFVRASKPPALPGFVRPASSRTKKKASGADVAAAYRAEVRRPKPSSAAPEPSVAVVGPARMATCAACGATYDPLAREAHEASIAHQLAVGPRTRGRRVMLPEANPGAKILERMGQCTNCRGASTH